MKGCLVHHSNDPPSIASTDPPKRPKKLNRKSVSFCGSSSEEEQEKVEVYVADDWDRTPCQVTPKLSYQDILELYELKLSAPRASSDKSGFGQGLPTLLEGVPVALLPLLSNDKPAPSSSTPPVSSSRSSVKPSSEQLRALPLGDGSRSSITSTRASAFRPPPSSTRSGLKNFQFLPIYPTEDQSSHHSDVSNDQDSDHAMPSPTSTPSLTSSNNSSPSSPSSASPSPSERQTLCTSASTVIDSYFDLPLQQSVGSVRQVNSYKAGTRNPGGATAAKILPPASKNLSLRALSSPNPAPPSQYDLQGSISQGQYLHERTQQQQNGFHHVVLGPGKLKEPPRRFFYTGGDDDVDEPFFH